MLPSSLNGRLITVATKSRFLLLYVFCFAAFSRAQNICPPLAAHLLRSSTVLHLPARSGLSAKLARAMQPKRKIEASFSPDDDSSLRTDGTAGRRGEKLRRIRWTGYRKSMRRVPHRAPSIGGMRTVVPRVDPTARPLRLAAMPTCLCEWCEWCECECECELECPAHTRPRERASRRLTAAMYSRPKTWHAHTPTDPYAARLQAYGAR